MTIKLRRLISMAWEAGKGVLFAGEAKILVYGGVAETLTVGDLIGELTDISGMGASRETKEFGGFHYKQKKKSAGQSTPNDVSFTENLTQEQLTKVRGWYKNNTPIYIACANAENDEVLYCCKGTISQWGEELPDGDICKLTYTMIIENDEPAVTVPTNGADSIT